MSGRRLVFTVEPMKPRPRPPKIEIPPVKLCQSYRPGHSVHWIQAGKSRDDGQRVPGRIVDISGDLVVVSTAEGIRRYRNHDPGRLELLARKYGAGVAIQGHWSILTVAGYYISITADSGRPLAPCMLENLP
jgi:hypothetical protein